MDIPPPPPGHTSWLRATTSSSRTTTRFGVRLKGQRPNISAPIGPIKNSRGPDFSRSETLLIVDGISDCVSSSPPSTSPPSNSSSLKSNQKKTRQVSACLKPPPSKPTVARSNVTASTKIETSLGRSSLKQLRQVSSSASLSPKVPPRPYLKASSTVSLLPTQAHMAMSQDENVPPEIDTSFLKPVALRSRLPKSRTMSVLHDLRVSISKTSLNEQGGDDQQLKTPASVVENRQDSLNTRLPSKIESPTRPLSKPVPPPLRHRESLLTSPRPSVPGLENGQVHKAQASAYWSGRFVSLYDKFLAEGLTTIPRGVIPSPCHPSPPRLTLTPDQPKTTSSLPLPSSATAINLTNPTMLPSRFPELSEEEKRTRRVFRHLETVCVTGEARESLKDWQKAYARRHQRPALDISSLRVAEARKKTMSRLLDGAQRAGRRSISALRESAAAAAQGGKKNAVEHADCERYPRE